MPAASFSGSKRVQRRMSATSTRPESSKFATARALRRPPRVAADGTWRCSTLAPGGPLVMPRHQEVKHRRDDSLRNHDQSPQDAGHRHEGEGANPRRQVGDEMHPRRRVAFESPCGRDRAREDNNSEPEAESHYGEIEHHARDELVDLPVDGPEPQDTQRQRHDRELDEYPDPQVAQPLAYESTRRPRLWLVVLGRWGYGVGRRG